MATSTALLALTLALRAAALELPTTEEICHHAKDLSWSHMCVLKKYINEAEACKKADESIPLYDIFGNGEKKWQMAFKAMAGIEHSVYKAFTTVQTEAVDPVCKEPGASSCCQSHFRNNQVLDKWEGVTEVAFVVYKGQEAVANVVFDGEGSTNQSWFDQARIVSSSWTDIKTQPSKFFSIAGHDLVLRRFMMQRDYNMCPGDHGWFVVTVDDQGPGEAGPETYVRPKGYHCLWDFKQFETRRWPFFMYSNATTYSNENSAQMAAADAFAVFVSVSE